MNELGSDLRVNWSAMFKDDKKKDSRNKPKSAKNTQKKIEKAQKILDKVRNDINGILERGVHRSLEQFDRMSPEAQAALVQFWKEMREFIAVFANWIESLISDIIDRLLAGQRLEKRAFAKTFDVAIGTLVNRLNETASRHSVLPMSHPGT